ncbi:Flp pilus assembly protein CpaB [uncultured Thiodictyon sp.]|uniref:Flp pilus assembly protein CpaB n=1 Tax=uncultured Thiodictyon sp. TaxID=1846217 RepID=UPI0025D9BA19|nr:Flp pilus assembly protein CpaB [uncultured Thiodictyon sp.]
MNPRTLLMLLISLALAGGAAYSANRWMTTRMAASAEAAGAELVGVVAAAVDIPFGTKIDAAAVKMVQLPRAAVPPTAIRDLQTVVGRVAAVALVTGEVILQGRVVGLVGDSALGSVLQEGKRAFTIQPNNLVGIAGFVVPGNRVDLMGNQRRSDGGAEFRTFLRNLKVLQVDPPPSPDQKGTVVVRSLTLEVGPAEAEKIVAASQAGPVQVMLRNPLEVDIPETAPEPPAAKIEPPVAKVEPLAPTIGPAVPGPTAVATTPSQTSPAQIRREPERVLVIRGTKWERQYTGVDFAKSLEEEKPPPMAAADAINRGAAEPMPAKGMVDYVNNKYGSGPDSGQ